MAARSDWPRLLSLISIRSAQKHLSGSICSREPSHRLNQHWQNTSYKDFGNWIELTSNDKTRRQYGIFLLLLPRYTLPPSNSPSRKTLLPTFSVPVIKSLTAASTSSSSIFLPSPHKNWLMMRCSLIPISVLEPRSYMYEAFPLANLRLGNRLWSGIVLVSSSPPF